MDSGKINFNELEEVASKLQEIKEEFEKTKELTPEEILKGIKEGTLKPINSGSYAQTPES